NPRLPLKSLLFICLLQLNDCHRGVVFDGLETLFSQNYFTATNAILKALNNRRFIYFVTLKMDYNVLKEQEKKIQEEKALEERRREEKELIWLEEMDEDEYEALPADVRARIDQKRLVLKKERIKREQKEKAERERIEREAREEEEKRKEEEIYFQLIKNYFLFLEKSDKEKKEQERLRLEKELAEKAAKEAAQAEAEEKEENEENKKEEIGIPHILVDCAERKIMTIQKVLEVIPSAVESRVSVSTKLRTLQMQGSRSNRSISRASVVTIENKRGLYFSSNFMSLIARSGSRKLQLDNSTNSLTPINFLHKLESLNNSNANNESLREDGSSLLDMLMLQLDANNAVNVKQMEHITYENLLLESGKLPTKQEVMDGLGLGPQGPPIPPAAEFAVVPYPVKRKPPPMPEVGGKYTFMSSSPDDPNIGGEDKVKEPEQEELISATPEKSKEDQLKSKTSKAASDKGRSSVDRKRSGERKRISRRNSNVQISSPSDLANALSDAEGSRPSTRNTSRTSSQLGAPVSNVEEKIPPKPLTIFRWIIPPGADVVLRLRFLSNDLGQFDQTLNFEIVGTRRRYQLFCRGVCAFPNISKEPRVVFVGRKKNYRSDEIVHKKYILKTETFEFGPHHPSFDKVLLHRKDTKTIYLRNSTQLPVAWRLSGLENLGDDFTVAADSGIVDPLSEYPLHAYFRAMKAIQINKKMIRLEISDAENIMGVVHTEPIQVTAEAYDVALDMSFPKGTDGGLDFGVVKVNEEGRQTCTLKNKGKYEIAFNFLLESDAKNANIKSLFSVIPSSGKLNPQDRPTQVQVIFKTNREVNVKEMPILKCQVIEPSLGDQGEVIASIPVKVSVKAVFSKFTITPVQDINFGAMLLNSRKTRFFVIENKGEFDFKYTITKKEKDPNVHNKSISRPTVKGDKSMKLRDDNSTPSFKQKKMDSIRMDPSQSKLTLGMFTIFPAFGIILPNGSQSITVECVGETPGKEVQEINLEISDRDPNYNKGGIPYKLVAETCIPGINVDDLGSIFEEHRICKNLTIWQHLNCGNQEAGGVYGEEEKKFIFNNVIVGRTAKARFKISNNNKVPCDVAFTLKPTNIKGSPKTSDVFDLEPSRIQIANHSFTYVTISFTPPSMQSYSAMFEASIEGLSPNQVKGKSLVFEVSGEGNLPRITIAKPTVRNKTGQPLLLFKRLLVGRSESLPFELFNDGTLPSKVNIDVLDSDQVFMLKPTKETRDLVGDISYENPAEIRKKAHTASVVINPNERATFEVIYQPREVRRSQASIKVTVIDNQYEDYIVQMVGEGYKDDITLDNIGSMAVYVEPENELGNMAEEDVDAAKSNVMNFSDCYINESCTLNLTMTSHSTTDCVRFQWPDYPEFTFSPQIGHLHAGCTKDIAVTFTPKSAQSFSQVPIQCRVAKIIFDKPMEMICDWDDKVQVVKWVDNNPPATPTFPNENGSRSHVPENNLKPSKKKVVETEPEPQYTEIADSARDIELLVSGVADYTKCSCEVESIHFKSTPMFQTRVYSVVLNNEGKVALNYHWHVLMDSFTPSVQRSVTFMSNGDRPESRVDVVDIPYTPFFVEPEFGTIAAGKSASCVVKFAPLDANDYEGRLICRVWVEMEIQELVNIKAKNLYPCEVGFEFVSNDQDVVESFWKFSIPSRAITIPFMMVGYTREPNICLDRSHLNFKSLLIGREAKETVFLTNNEDTAFQFYFVENSCHSEGYSSHIKVEPMTGQIPPKSSVPIQIYFAPKTEKEVNFNLKCNIPHKKSPLTLNVKAEGYQMNSILLCEDSTLNRIELSERGINQINFGEVRPFFVHAFSLQMPFEFGVYLCFQMPFEFGVYLCFQMPFEHGICLSVINGPTYNLSIIGQSVTPGLQFSFKSHNFGNCFIYKTGVDLPKQQIILKLINKDKKEVSVDCLSVPTSQLAFKFEACVIPPNKKKKVTFSFTPTQPIKYQETVVFEINGLTKQKIEFFGVGHEMKIEVADPAHKCVNLGAKMVGDNVRKFIPVVNNSPAPITFNLALTPTEPALQQKEVLSIAPKEQITLEANGGTTKVEVWFRPKARIPQFTEEVLMECAGMSQPLFVVKGSCLGMEINLDSDYLAFGTVYQRSSSTRKLVMTNSGDMNSKFRWDIKRFKPDFSILPVEGYITPGMEVVFDVEFHPQSVSGDVRYDVRDIFTNCIVKCFLDGGPHKAVTLTLTGSCTGIPPVKEVQSFQCVVRQTDTRQIMIPNKSNQVWNLKPVIDGEYWTGPVSFIVDPQQTKSYELTYRPLTMTSENKKHTGSIFFPLPDGSGLLFNLVGTAEPPKVLARIQRDVPCKTGYSELLPVFNWLKKTQRFRVKIEPVKPEKLEPGTTVKGVEYIDVQANGKKDYKLSFYAYKEGISTLKVTFINEQTQEYQFYEVTFKATKPGVISTIYLATPVRQSVPYTLTLDNPLSNQVTFSISCTVAEVMLPSQLVIPAASQGHLTLEYQPLKVGEVTGRLELNCADLGQYLYDMVLNAQPSGQEKPIYFRTWLGSSVTQVAKFLNFAKQKTDYSCKIDNPDFHVEKTIAAAPGSTGGTEVALDVVFEPSKLGEQRAQLTVTSPLGSDYIFPLFGTCISPKPQGPFTVKSGSNLSIVFRNIFSTTTPFTFQVDNPLFHVAKPGESIRPHKDHRIVVGFDGTNIKNPVVGKLIVSCARSAGGASNVQWIYYLKGVSN
uniref:HYDIN/VesB/CFA65-like Ig-like domain-containing protein n=1 Tax=Biomphalaria glabrata TaxID=6526 RepID=A0A2C9K9X8_BIOGL